MELSRCACTGRSRAGRIEGVLTLGQLKGNTPNPVRRRAAGQCSGAVTTKAHKLSGPRSDPYREIKFGVRCTDGIRRVTVRFYAGGKISARSPVWVSCSCPYWLFYCEVAVASAGSSNVIYSNGKAPIVRNPGNVPYLCKHIYLVSVRGLQALEQAGLVEKSRAEAPRARRDKGGKEVYYLPVEGVTVDVQRPSLVTVPERLKKYFGG